MIVVISRTNSNIGQDNSANTKNNSNHQLSKKDTPEDGKENLGKEGEFTKQVVVDGVKLHKEIPRQGRIETSKQHTSIEAEHGGVVFVPNIVSIVSKQL